MGKFSDNEGSDPVVSVKESEVKKMTIHPMSKMIDKVRKCSYVTGNVDIDAAIERFRERIIKTLENDDMG